MADSWPAGEQLKGVAVRPLGMVLGAVFLILATGGAEAICVSPKDREALSMRLLQTELMVAALSCQRKSDYNAFIRRFEKELVVHGRNLKRIFKRTYGGKSRQLESFVTRVGQPGFAPQPAARFQLLRAV